MPNKPASANSAPANPWFLPVTLSDHKAARYLRLAKAHANFHTSHNAVTWYGPNDAPVLCCIYGAACERQFYIPRQTETTPQVRL